MWSTTTKGNRSVAKTIRLGEELEKASREQSNYHEFQRVVTELVEVNEKICQLRPASPVADENELELMKKNSGGGLPPSREGNRGDGGADVPAWRQGRQGGDGFGIC